MVVDIAFAVFLWLMFGTRGTVHALAHSQPQLKHLLQVSSTNLPQIFLKLSWLHIVLYFVILWISRVSLALSIARVFPIGTLARKSLVAMAIFFLFLCLFLMVGD